MIPSKEEWEGALALRHGKDRQERFASSTVAVCGLGGLGSHIAFALARAGIGRLILVDFDRVDLTNLHRQQYKASQIGMPKALALCDSLLEVAPYVRLEPRVLRLTEENAKEVLADADVICEAFDRAENKAMLVNLALETMPGKYLVAASGVAGIGAANAVKTRRIAPRFYLCGDGVSDTEKEGSLFASRVMVCAAHQAHAVLRILSGLFETD
ncbi:MAG: thiamine biosynthesis protein ThiF [Clostridia bacterium]|nr:thiamine biosynthesis protein ThiF [Clostridia bacterium]